MNSGWSDVPVTYSVLDAFWCLVLFIEVNVCWQQKQMMCFRAWRECSVTRLFLTWVGFFPFHFKQVRIQTVPASHLQQGTVSGSTKAVSTVVVTTAPSPKQTQDQLWTLVRKRIAVQELPWDHCHSPSHHPRHLNHSHGEGWDWILSRCLSGVSIVMSRLQFHSKRCCTYRTKCFSLDT